MNVYGKAALHVRTVNKLYNRVNGNAREKTNFSDWS